MSDKNIYGKVPDPPKNVIKQAMDDLDDSFSNTINGPLKSDDVRYDPENGE